MRTPIPTAALYLVLSACSVTGPTGGDDATDDDPIDGEDDAFEIGKADGACLPDVVSDEGRGVLALANDPAVSADELDAHGLHWRTADAIVAARPIADLAALDAVPTVGPKACVALRAYACDHRGLCERALSLWTWNIEHFPLTAGAIDRVAETLTGMGPEIVGFEEVDNLPAFDTLLTRLPAWEGMPGQYGFGTQVALAYRPDRLRVVATEDLFASDSRRFPRPPLAVTFEVTGKAGVGRVTVVVVHLKAMVDDDSEQRRREAIVVLEGWLAARRAAGDAAVFVIGDYNDDIDDAGAANVFRPFLDHPDRYAALTVPNAAHGDYSYIPFHRLIDHQVATVEAVKSFQPIAIDVIALDQTISGYASTVSDHRPVAARLIPILPEP